MKEGIIVLNKMANMRIGRMWVDGCAVLSLPFFSFSSGYFASDSRYLMSS